jgi:hypothetical protein
LSQCTEESTSRHQWTGITERCCKYKVKTQQSVANLEAIVFGYYL